MTSGYVMQEAYEDMDDESRDDWAYFGGNACNDPSCKGDCEGDCHITSWDGPHGPDDPEPGMVVVPFPFGGECAVMEA